MLAVGRGLPGDSLRHPASTKALPPRLLDRIPDPALRLFAQIELAAAMAGLEQIGGITREQVRR